MAEKGKRGKKQPEIFVIADGGIKIKGLEGSSFFRSFSKADRTVPAVSLASIVAKVLRDREMKRLSKIYSRYGFEIHKGYGTRDHIAAIKKHGPSEIHRRSFIKNIIKRSSQ